MRRTCPREPAAPRRMRKAKKTEVLPSTHRLKSEAKSSQLTGRTVNTIVNAHCYIPLNLGWFVMEQ